MSCARSGDGTNEGARYTGTRGMGLNLLNILGFPASVYLNTDRFQA